MAGTQALRASRTPAFSYDPNDLKISEREGDPLYQRERNELAITRDDVLAIATAGTPSSLKVRRRDDGDYIVTGRQRTKAAAVANELGAGVRYTGSLPAVRDAISEFAKDPDFCSRLTILMRNKSIRLVATSANHGDDNSVRTVMAIENAYAHGEAKAAIVRSVIEDSERFSHTAEMISLARKIPLSTVKRWIKKGLPQNGAKTQRAPSTRPNAKQLRAVFDGMFGPDKVFAQEHYPARVILGWVLGDVEKAQLIAEFPLARKALEKK